MDMCRAGEAAAFGELWRRHYGLTVALIRPIVQGDAEDVASEAFTAVWLQLRAGNGPETHFKAYVVCAAKRRAYRQSQQQRRVVSGITEEHLATASSRDPMLEVETWDQIAVALRMLPVRWAELLWLLGSEEMTRPELYRFLGLNPAAVSALTYRARNGFRKALELTSADSG